jgi:hypothetical protein
VVASPKGQEQARRWQGGGPSRRIEGALLLLTATLHPSTPKGQPAPQRWAYVRVFLRASKTVRTRPPRTSSPALLRHAAPLNDISASSAALIGQGRRSALAPEGRREATGHALRLRRSARRGDRLARRLPIGHSSEIGEERNARRRTSRRRSAGLVKEQLSPLTPSRAPPRTTSGALRDAPPKPRFAREREHDWPLPLVLLQVRA